MPNNPSTSLSSTFLVAIEQRFCQARDMAKLAYGNQINLRSMSTLLKSQNLYQTWTARPLSQCNTSAAGHKMCLVKKLANESTGTGRSTGLSQNLPEFIPAEFIITVICVTLITKFTEIHAASAHSTEGILQPAIGRNALFSET
jgi:hypothetical protein